MSSDDESGSEAGLTLMFALGGIAMLIFLAGIGVIWFLSYGG